MTNIHWLQLLKLLKTPNKNTKDYLGKWIDGRGQDFKRCLWSIGKSHLEKIAEECGETLIASKNDENLVYESVDLIFHTLLLLAYKGVEFDEILEEFERRRK